jgi:hypothetical protein
MSCPDESVADSDGLDAEAGGDVLAGVVVGGVEFVVTAVGEVATCVPGSTKGGSSELVSVGVFGWSA